MAGSFNKVILMGNITRDIDVRFTPSGTAVTDLGLAVNEKRKNANGELIEETVFVDVTVWGRSAEVAGEYLGKGSPVLIEGRLKLDQWETDGERRQKLKVVCDRMQMVGSKREGSSNGNNGGGSGKSSNAKSARPSNQDDGGGAPADDDIPF